MKVRQLGHLLFARKASWYIFAILYLAFATYYLRNAFGEQSFTESLRDHRVAIFLSIVLFQVSHILRALRIYIVSAFPIFQLKSFMLIQFFAFSLGNLFLPFSKEILFLFLFWIFFGRGLPRIAFSLVYIRIFDLIFVTSMFLARTNMGLSEKNTAVFLFFVAAITLTFLMLFMQRLLNILTVYFVKYQHSSFSLFMVGQLSKAQSTITHMKMHRSEKIFVTALLTLAVWVVEFFSVFVIMNSVYSEQWIETIQSLSTNILSGLRWQTFNSAPAYLFIYASFVGVSTALILFNLRKKSEISSHLR